MASVKLNNELYALSYATYTGPVPTSCGDLPINYTQINLLGDKIEWVENKKYIFDNGNYILCSRKGARDRPIFAWTFSNGRLLIESYCQNSTTGELTFTTIGKVYVEQAGEFKDRWAVCYKSSTTGDIRVHTCVDEFISGFTDGIKVELFPGPDSGEGGGSGDFDGTSDPIDFPPLPTISAISTKMLTLFNPSPSTLTELSRYLWKPDFVDAIAKLFQSPMEAIIDLSFVNVNPVVSGTNTIAVGWISTGIEAPIISQQYVILNCGILHVDEYWGSALDYNPYTTIEIYLPYIGLMRLDTDDCMGSDLEVRYYIDLLTGTCVAMIKVTKGNLSSILYSFTGNASAHIPLSATNMSQLIQGVMTVAAQMGIGVATGGSSAMTAVTAGSAMNVLSGKMHVEKGGRLDTTGGMLSIKTPYLIITRPLQSLATDYNKFNGYPSNITATLSSLTGYTEVEYVHLENFTALENEKQEIESLLKSGVIF